MKKYIRKNLSFPPDIVEAAEKLAKKEHLKLTDILIRGVRLQQEGNCPYRFNPFGISDAGIKKHG